MTAVKWLEVHIDTNHTGLEPVETMLSALGIDGVVIDDETEFEDFLENNGQYWDYVDEDLRQEMQGRSRITFYLEAGDEGFAKLGEVRIALEELKKTRDDCGTLLMTLDDLEDADWENNWKQYYKPMEIGDRLLVVPEWLREDPKVRAGLAAGRVALVLDPGLTFGTGSHATTRLCLTALEKTIRGGERVLDLGCGSGILSIAALVLGASAAAAVDIDPKAVDVAYENAALNGIGRDRYTVRAGNVLTDGALVAELARQKYALVLANIVADVIIPMSARAGEFLDTDGVFLCSGIFDTRAGDLEAALERNGLAVFERREQNGWVALAARTAR